MSIKYLLGIVSLCVVIFLGIISINSMESGKKVVKKVVFEEFSPCLPKIKLSQQELLEPDEVKVSKAQKLCDNVEKSLKTLSGSHRDPEELWLSLKRALLAEEFLKNCKNQQGTLLIRTIDLKSELQKTQKEWVKDLQMEVVRYRRQKKDKEVLFCLRRLLRLVPDEKHPYHQKWLKETSS